MRRAPTIRDVAGRAGLSVATVSRAINATGPVSPESLAAVQAAMAAVGFRPNAIGRQLKTGEARSVGVIVPTLANPVFADVVAGVQSGAAEAGFAVLVAATDYARDQEGVVAESLLAHRVAGLIATVTDADCNPVLDRLDEEDVPYVLTFNQPARADRAAVSIDNRRAFAELTGYLAGLGHRDFAMLAGRFGASDRSRRRFEGFGDALEAAGLPPGRLLEVGFDAVDLRSPLAALLAERSRPTALVCSTDLIAIAALRAARSLGLRLPEDLSIAGFDGIAVGALVSPSLTTVVQPRQAMGLRAFELLQQRLKGRAPAAPLVLPHSLRLGESTAPPPDAAVPLPVITSGDAQ